MSAAGSAGSAPAASGVAVAEARNVSKVFNPGTPREFLALEGLSFSIEDFPGPVTNNMRFIPARVSSSTTYCTPGLRPTGSISLGWDLVAGRSRVPKPATGTTAMLTSFMRRWRA